MILVIRISGMVKVPKSVSETLYRLRLRRKYSAILLEDDNQTRKLLHKVRSYVAYGKVDEKTLEKLISSRGQKTKNPEGKRFLAKKGLKPFLRLHPPRGGIDSKKHFGVNKGVLGDNKDKIKELVERML